MRLLVVLLLMLAVRPLYEPRGEIYVGLVVRWYGRVLEVRSIEGDVCEIRQQEDGAFSTHWLMRDEVRSIKNGGYKYNTLMRTIRMCPGCYGKFEVFKEYCRPCTNCGKGEL